MTFGDRIDWNAEARRAEKAETPGVGPNELTLRLASMLSVPRPDAPVRVADCGCNIGRFCPAVTVLGFEYVGIDQATEALTVAQRRYPGTRFERAMLWDDWPPRIGLVDGAICNAVLQHNTLVEKRQILPRIAQAVRIGGAFVMQESTVLEETPTQLRQCDWVALVEEYGFKLASIFHPNEYRVFDGYAFRRV